MTTRSARWTRTPLGLTFGPASTLPQRFTEGAFASKGPVIASRLRGAAPNRAAILDCELVACDATGSPCFGTLMRERGRAATLCVWAFDLLALDDDVLLAMTWTKRRAALASYIANIDAEYLQFSPDFDDGAKVLYAAERMGLEGVVSKRRASPYRAYPTGAWLKVKTPAWRAANKDRGEMFRMRARR